MTDFQPLRRKLGIVALLMACVFTAGWVRSLSTVDMSGPYATQKNRNSYSIVLSERSAIRLIHIRGDDEFFLTPMRLFQSFRINPNEIYNFGSYFQVNQETPGSVLAYQEGEEIRGRQKMTVYVLYYWPIVLPLTLLSAYLLYSNPRPAEKVPA